MAGETEDQVLEQEQAGQEQGAGGDAGPAGGQDAGGDAGDRRPTVREALEKGFEESRKGERQEERRGKAQQSRARREMGAGGGEDAAGAAEGAAAAADQGEAAKPPPGWPKDAAEHWRTMTPAQQAAVSTRLEASEKGVQQLRAQYAGLDQALAPHMEAIRGHRMEPHQAVAQLFAWFQALAANPAAAFPALAKSFNVDLARLVGGGAAAADKAAAAKDAAGEAATGKDAAQPQIDLAPHLNPIVGAIEELRRAQAEEGERRTRDAIASWAADKPHFEDVRQLMGQLVASGAVPLKDGRVDLDGAYNMAIHAHDGVRAKVEAERAKAAEDQRKAAEQKRLQGQQQHADRARRAAASVTGGAPAGTTIAEQNRKPKKGMSVRESLNAAIEELSQ